MATREAALDRLASFLADPERLVVAANAAFDLGLFAAHRGQEALALIFAALEAGRVKDVLIRQQLADIADGFTGKDRTRFGAQLKGRVNTEYLARLYLGLDLSHEKKDPNSPRVRFAEVDGLPLEQYPADFTAYSLGDAEHELAIYEAQEAQGIPNLARETEEVQAAWALHLMSIRGLRTDPESVTKITAELQAKYDASTRKFLEAGIYKIVPCNKKPLKDGQTERVYETADAIGPEELAVGVGREWYARAARYAARGAPLRYGEDSKALEAMVVEAYLGNPPLTDKGNIKANRDTLIESGADLLMEYGDSTNTAKLLKTYCPILAQGTHTPINARFNVLVESLRTSGYDPNLQNLPK